jgi:hypothetical protein
MEILTPKIGDEGDRYQDHPQEEYRLSTTCREGPGEDRSQLKALVKSAFQEVLEAEMTEAIRPLTSHSNAEQ